MGWTWMQREKGRSDREFFTEELLSDRYRIVDCATKRDPVTGERVFYAAVENVTEEAHGEVGDVWALVCLTNWAPNDTFNFGYKDMEESMGPSADGCPTRILDLLTPTDSEYANQWRERCRKAAEAEAELPPIRKGTRMKFPDWLGDRVFEVVDGRRGIFSENGYRIRLRGFRGTRRVAA